jgi:hypothetical protein
MLEEWLGIGVFALVVIKEREVVQTRGHMRVVRYQRNSASQRWKRGRNDMIEIALARPSGPWKGFAAF